MCEECDWVGEDEEFEQLPDQALYTARLYDKEDNLIYSTPLAQSTFSRVENGDTLIVTMRIQIT